ncbi:SPOR domain-containing protein [Verminephrobacter aporrectodeae subsp. tuberculatae]|uniref:SPOR domain-containing protein n=1 Tax=Verminephrobacter aporrectodeae subsp. tuberculatae TaxID=1110392 RepID=A0ABT3KYI2_9BURK|nr:hypothetical protein [Verminephrobacter aporrectodeae]MCW5223591.1 SPOR domain-containing protein [Verminephrobacter aporrectodeae subsp. tuberculatae]MCW5289056.1 SPOR domain-containing protein [Verminephrobacter aporrectodeae subsp. tuberculatae]MCW5323393.1 SPOR domain-containing protein [Verminephrobacter aporrectodeae subsp. tuberculatae]MCW8164420.1 SPOR domain-containing protein [Verminephrobacter aporrectodeae subsp. tuberculatae]MCW8169326.1 SPOR domain-containing protein [Verminep
MLRFALIVLLLANAGYGAWSHGLLRPWGLAPQEQTEPQRMRQQIRPETLQILKSNPNPGAAAGPPDPQPPVSAQPAGECLQAGVFDERQAAALRAATAALPQDSWVLEPTPLQTGRWMVYMGRFDDLETLDKKRTELRTRKVDFDRAGGTLEPGLSLGRFSSENAAKRELANLVSQGVRTARVVQERPESPGFTLRLPAVNEALRPQLETLRNAMAGKTLRACG